MAPADHIRCPQVKALLRIASAIPELGGALGDVLPYIGVVKYAFPDARLPGWAPLRGAPQRNLDCIVIRYLLTFSFISLGDGERDGRHYLDAYYAGCPVKGASPGLPAVNAAACPRCSVREPYMVRP